MHSFNIFWKVTWSFLHILTGFQYYRVRQCYCHPLYKPFCKHQQKCRTKIPLKILPGIQKSSLKISITKIGKNFSVFSVILKILENFGFVIWKYINSQIFPTHYDFNAMSQKKYNFVLSLRFGPLWTPYEGSKWGLSHIDLLLVPMS